MQTKFADLAMPDIGTNMQYAFVQPSDSFTTFIGMWNFGLPESEASSAQLVGLPQFSLDGITSKVARKDVTDANGALTNNPRRVFGAFRGARTLLVNLLQREKTLAGKGYGFAARADAMERDVKDAIEMMNEWAGALKDVTARIDALEFAAATRFPDTEESELQQTMHDVAIVARVGPLTDQDLAAMRHGDMPPRLNDPRLIQALYRVPAAAHGIGPDHMALLRKTYAAVYAPCTTRAVALLRDMIEAARTVLCSLAVRLAVISCQTPQAILAKVVNGEWIGERVNAVGLSAGDLHEVSVRAAQAGA